MKSKSLNAGSSSSASKINLAHNNTFDFIRLYKTAEETKATLQKYKTSTEGITFNDYTDSPRPEKSASKRKKGKQTVEMTHISINGLSLDRDHGAGPSSPLNEAHKATSTPISRKDKVKSIMKPSTTPVVDDAMDGSKAEVYIPKPKKRNKSVSFMLDDIEQLEIKKTKSEDNIVTEPRVKTNKLKKKLKKDRQAEKENNIRDSNHSMESNNKNKDKIKKQLPTVKPNETDTPSSTSESVIEKKKRSKTKKTRKLEGTSPSTSKPETTQVPTEKSKKAKKKKRELKRQTDNDEPAQKFAKTEEKEMKPEVIAEDLSNLSIGDNATTLSSLLDEMTVTDKDKKKKLRKKITKSKKESKDKETAETEQQKSEEIKEKKWKRKRWNKEKKVKETTESATWPVIVDNLPICLLFTYKKVLAEHFAKCGLLRSVGIAEVYPSEVSKPVFTTTVFFDTEDAATKALEEDKTTIEGSKIRVSRPLPATLTTAVVRTYGVLSEQALSSAFASAGRVRAIRLAVKGKNTMSTAFIEFDGPAAVERAIKIVEDVKIGGKKIHISKFEIRPKKNKEEKSGAAGDGDYSDDGGAQT